MKHIKPYVNYHLFESSLSQYYEPDAINKSEEVMLDLKDILLELTDIGYYTHVAYASLVRLYLSYKSPVISISITRPTERTDSFFNAGFKLNPLWNNEDEKIEFDDVILRILRYSTSEGYKYEYETIKSSDEDTKGQIIKYVIKIYKEE